MADFELTYPVSNIILDPIYNEAPFVAESGITQVRAKLGSRWRMGLLWQNAHNSGKNLAQIRGFILGLRGRLNRAIIKPTVIAGWERQGLGGGFPTLQTAVAVGATSCTITGASANVDPYLQPGDLFMIANELKMVAGNFRVLTNGAGQTTISFWPEMRVARGAGTFVDITEPSGIFEMVSHSPFDSGSPSFEHHDTIALDLEETLTP